MNAPPKPPSFFPNIFIIHTKPLDVSPQISIQTLHRFSVIFVKMKFQIVHSVHSVHNPPDLILSKCSYFQFLTHDIFSVSEFYYFLTMTAC